MSFSYSKTTINTPTVTTAVGSAALSGVSSQAGWFVGATIEGAGIPAGTVIEGWSGTAATMSAVATASATITATVSSERITQTGTDTSLAALNGMASVITLPTPGNMPTKYVINRGALVVNGTLTITGRSNILEFGGYTEYDALKLGNNSYLTLDGSSASGVHLQIPVIIFGRNGSGGYSAFAMSIGSGVRLYLKNCEIRGSQGLELSNITSANFTVDGDVKFYNYAFGADGSGNMLFFQPPTLVNSGTLYFIGGWRLFVVRSDTVANNPVAFNAVTEGIGSFQSVPNLRFTDVSFVRNAGSGLLTRANAGITAYGYLRNPALGTAITVNTWADTSFNKGGYAISKFVGHTIKTIAGSAVSGAVVYAKDYDNGKRGNPTTYLGLTGADAAVFNGSGDKYNLWQTDAGGSATAQDVYTAFFYTPNGVVANFVRDYRTKSGISGNDTFDFITVAYGYIAQTQTVNLVGTGTLLQPWSLLADSNITLSESAAIAKLSASFSLNTSTNTLTVTSAATLDDLYDAMKAYKTRYVQAQLEYGGVGNLLFAPAGSVLTSALNLVGTAYLSIGSKFTSFNTTGVVDMADGGAAFAFQDAAGVHALVQGLDPKAFGTTWVLGWIKNSDYIAAPANTAPATWTGWNQTSGTGNSTHIELAPNTIYQIFLRCPGYNNGVIGPVVAMDTTSQSLLTIPTTADKDVFGVDLWPQSEAYAAQTANFTYSFDAQLVEYSNTNAATEYVPFLATYRALETLAKQPSLIYHMIKPVYVNGTRNGFVLPRLNPLQARMTAASSAGIIMQADVRYEDTQLPAYDRFKINAANTAGALISIQATAATEVSAASVTSIRSGLALAANVPSALATAAAVRTNLETELGRMDVAVSTRSKPSDVVNVNIVKVNNVTVTGTGEEGAEWGPAA